MGIDVKRVFDEAVAPYPGARWACCPLDFSEWAKLGTYNYALIVYDPYDEVMGLTDYSESRQFQLRCRKFDEVNEIGAHIRVAAKKAGIPFFVPPVSRDHMSPPYMNSISNKYIGVRSGIGWIGKNDLLITYEYGPRIWTWGALFYADHMEVRPPVVKSECGSCDLCRRACPYHNIKGTTWQEGIPREELVNYHNCSVARFALGKRLHLDRKFMCARCLLACPQGIGNIKKVIGEH